MSAKIGTVRMERNRAIQGQKDMRRHNRELAKEIAELRAASEKQTGPGSPSARLSWLLGELARLFPDATNLYGAAPPEIAYFEKLTQLANRQAQQVAKQCPICESHKVKQYHECSDCGTYYADGDDLDANAARGKQLAAQQGDKPFCYMSETYEVALLTEPPKAGSQYADMFPVYRRKLNENQ
jgi:hypothetical protein